MVARSLVVVELPGQNRSVRTPALYLAEQQLQHPQPVRDLQRRQSEQFCYRNSEPSYSRRDHSMLSDVVRRHHRFACVAVEVDVGLVSVRVWLVFERTDDGGGVRIFVRATSSSLYSLYHSRMLSR